MAKTRQQKEQTVVILTDKLGRAKSAVFTDYKGLTMAQLSDLRSKLQEVGADFTITKNSLLRLAIENLKLKIENSLFKGPTATLFAYDDEITPIKLLSKTLKDAQVGKVKAGLFESELMDEYQINKLASLPSKDELRAKIVEGLGAPLYGIVGVLQANLRNLVFALEQVRIQRSASAA